MAFGNLMQFLQSTREAFKIEQALQEKVAGTDMTLDELLDRDLTPKFEAIAAALPKTMADKIKGFREEVGPEAWAALSANPSLPALIRQWCDEQYKKAIKQMAEAMSVFLGTESGIVVTPMALMSMIAFDQADS